MEPTRFDALSRSLASSATRRDAVRGLGAGGLAAGLLGYFGLRTAAQSDAVTCTYDFLAETATGPNEDEVYEGVLTLVIEPDGAIDDATLATEDEVFEAVGQAVGRALSLRIELDDDLALSLHGVGERDIERCRGEIAGTFGGPEMRDLGTWRAVRKSGTGTTGGSSGGSGGTLKPATKTPESGSQPTPTPKPCPPKDCGPAFVVDPETCECDCPKPYDRCGDICCFGDAVCSDPGSGTCYCPDGTEPCKEVCTPLCETGQALDPDSCKCEASDGCQPGETNCAPGICADLQTDDAFCGSCDNPCPLFSSCKQGVCESCNGLNAPCQTHDVCCSGYCQSGGTCGNCSGTVCGGIGGCYDVNNDENHCGFCDNACPAGVPCIGGSCQCPYGYAACPGGCSDVSSDMNNCGSCGYVCPTVNAIDYQGAVLGSLQMRCEGAGCCGQVNTDCSDGTPCCGGLTCVDTGSAYYCS